MNLALVPATLQAMTVVGEEATTDPAVTQMQQLVQETYQWGDGTYKTAAFEHLQGLRLAHQCGLATQVTLHTQKIQELVTRDLVKQTTPGLPKYNKYSGFSYALSEHHTYMLASNHFEHSLKLPGEPASSTWQFYRIATFKQVIPPVALHFLAALAQVGLRQHDFWVADNKPPLHLIYTAHGGQTRIDPILFANFGYTFVALVAWV